MASYWPAPVCVKVTLPVLQTVWALDAKEKEKKTRAWAIARTDSWRNGRVNVFFIRIVCCSFDWLPQAAANVGRWSFSGETFRWKRFFTGCPLRWSVAVVVFLPVLSPGPGGKASCERPGRTGRTAFLFSCWLPLRINLI